MMAPHLKLAHRNSIQSFMFYSYTHKGFAKQLYYVGCIHNNEGIPQSTITVRPVTLCTVIRFNHCIKNNNKFD